MNSSDLTERYSDFLKAFHDISERLSLTQSPELEVTPHLFNLLSVTRNSFLDGSLIDDLAKCFFSKIYPSKGFKDLTSLNFRICSPGGTVLYRNSLDALLNVDTVQS